MYITMEEQQRELRAVLAAHAARYPLMEPADAVKLLYQNEFGGGHLIADPAESLVRLRRELAATPRDPALPPIEEIGNGILRVNLGALDTEKYPVEQLNRDFVRSAELHRGDVSSFQQKLLLLEELTAEGLFGFSSAALADYLGPYAAAGYPAVSHSDAYRAAYHPAYRVVLRSLYEGQSRGRGSPSSTAWMRVSPA